MRSIDLDRGESSNKHKHSLHSSILAWRQKRTKLFLSDVAVNIAILWALVFVHFVWMCRRVSNYNFCKWHGDETHNWKSCTFFPLGFFFRRVCLSLKTIGVAVSKNWSQIKCSALLWCTRSEGQKKISNENPKEDNKTINEITNFNGCVIHSLLRMQSISSAKHKWHMRWQDITYLSYLKSCSLAGCHTQCL